MGGYERIVSGGGWRFDTKGFGETMQALEACTNINGIQKLALYQGADSVADEMRRQVSSLKTSQHYMTGKMRYCFPEDKAALEKNLGIAKFSETKDGVNTKVGFDDYFEGRNGERIPVPLVANAINAGTSFMYKQPFISKTIANAKTEAYKRMESVFDAEFERLLKKQEGDINHERIRKSLHWFF